MKTLLTSTALIIGLAGASLAESQETEVGVVKMSEANLLVREMLGEPVYNFRGRHNTDDLMPLSGLERFEKVARIKDVMINTDGTVEALVLSVGVCWVQVEATPTCKRGLIGLSRRKRKPHGARTQWQEPRLHLSARVTSVAHLPTSLL